MPLLRRLPLLVGLLLATGPLSASVKLASPFGDHMVLQEGRPIPIWGTADAGEKVTVEFGGKSKSTTAGPDGKWRLELRRQPTSVRAQTLTVTGSATAALVILNDVLVGEVWLCGGQSNMERQLGPRPPQQPILDWEKEVAAADHPLIRQFYVPPRTAVAPEEATAGSWTVCSPATVANFSAVGYFFARDLQAAQGGPIGIIHSSYGGTPAEAWTSAEGLAGFPEFSEDVAQLAESARDPVKARNQSAEHLAAWYAANDPGSGDHPWSATQLDTGAWETMNLPTAWEDAGHPGYDGVAWFRRGFDVPKAWLGQPVELRLGAVDDADTTWINGTWVGATDGWTTPRVYRIPAGVLKPTGNVVAVRVLDTGGNGGIWNPAQPLEVAPVSGPGQPVSLRGPWRARFSRPLQGAPRVPASGSPKPGTPTVLFNAMIAPLVPFAIRGVAFYQGEANAERAAQYRTLFPALIADWRRRWHEGDFPFLFVQIAPFRDQPPEIREAQLLAGQATKNTAMVVTIDCGDANDIHPPHKQPVGARLALAARALAYGEKVEYSGPVYAGLKIAGNRAILHFSHVGAWLLASGGPLTGFTVAGPDGVFHPAKAEIADDSVTVSAAEVAAPVAVRYGWANVAAGNLFNSAGLPASPFRTDSPPAKP